MKSGLKLFLLFLACGFTIFAVPLFLVGAWQAIYRVSLSAIFLVASLLLRRSKDNSKFFLALFAFFIASLVYTLDYFLYANWSSLNLTFSRMDQYVLAKVISTLVVVVPIIVLTKATHNDLPSIYLTKGNLRLGLMIGVGLFLFFLATSIPTATFLYGGKHLTYEDLISWAPWIFVFVLSNGVREELWFRGLFLKKYQPFVGATLSNLLQGIIFVLPHFGEIYSTVFLLFVFITFVLGLAFGVIMQRTNSLLGSVLFHAGTDIPVILGIFSNF